MNRSSPQNRLHHRYANVFPAALILLFSSCLLEPITKIDPTQGLGRDGWQKPSEVMRGLDVQAGSTVADIGAGHGYFTFSLADAVGPSGKVYAVEVDVDLVRELQDEVKRRGYSNIDVVMGHFDDPLLPDGQLDLVLMCNVYHHIDNRVAYMERLKSDLKPGGRIAIVDLKEMPLVHLTGHGNHTTDEDDLQTEMLQAGFSALKEYDFLPFQEFQIFSLSSDGVQPPSFSMPH